MRKRMLAGLAAALLLLFASAAAENAAYLRDYGGSGQDSYNGLAAMDGGLLVSGSTSSTDGDLSERTRSGKAGWLFRLDEKGQIVWSFCTARSGMDTIIRPTVHNDGRVTCVLVGEEGAEWIELDERGRTKTRVSVPKVETYCLHQRFETAEAAQALIPYDEAAEPCLALITLHGDETCCMAKLRQDGTFSRGLSFVVTQNERQFARCRDGSGRIAMAYIDQQDEETGAGQVGLCYVKPGTDEAPEVVQVDTDGLKCNTLLDCEPMADGSLLLSAQQVFGGCMIARVNALEETLFTFRMDNLVDQICETASGFAVTYNGGAAYFDEDGYGLGTGETVDGGEDSPVMPADMAAFGDGVAILYTAYSTGLNRDRIRVIAGDGLDTNEEEYQNALFWRENCTLLDAWGDESGAVLLLEQRDGERLNIHVDAAGQAREMDGVIEPRPADGWKTSSGTLTWRAEQNGASVALTAPDGRELWRTRTPIHTVADRLEWRCAAELPDGRLALGGRYTYDAKQGTRQEGVMAIIGLNAALQKLTLVKTYEGRYAGDVCDMLVHPQKGLLMLVSGGKWVDVGGVSQIVSEDGRFSMFVSVGLESHHAHLIMDGLGHVYLAGMDEDNGLSRAVLVGVNLDTGEITH